MSTETSTRPFQVGDRVKITVRDVMTGKMIRSHTGKIRSLKDMSSAEPGVGDWVTCITEVDAPYLMGKSDTEHTVAISHLAVDRTRTTWAASEEIELLDEEPEAAPTEAPQDHGPLAAHLSDRTLAKVLSRPAYVPRETPSLVELDRREAEAARTKEWERVMSAAIEWEYADAYPDSPAARDATEALDDLRSAVRAYRESEAARGAVQS